MSENEEKRKVFRDYTGSNACNCVEFPEIEGNQQIVCGFHNGIVGIIDPSVGKLTQQWNVSNPFFAF